MYSHSVTNPCELPSHREPRRSHENAKQMIPRSPIVKLSTFLLPIFSLIYIHSAEVNSKIRFVTIFEQYFPFRPDSSFDFEKYRLYFYLSKIWGKFSERLDNTQGYSQLLVERYSVSKLPTVILTSPFCVLTRVRNRHPW